MKNWKKREEKNIKKKLSTMVVCVTLLRNGMLQSLTWNSILKTTLLLDNNSIKAEIFFFFVLLFPLCFLSCIHICFTGTGEGMKTIWNEVKWENMCFGAMSVWLWKKKAEIEWMYNNTGCREISQKSSTMLALLWILCEDSKTFL